MSNPSIEGTQSLLTLRDRVYADKGFSELGKSDLIKKLDLARAKLAADFGEKRAPDPDLIFCKDDPCIQYFAGENKRSIAFTQGAMAPGGSYRAVRPTIVMVVDQSNVEAVMVHELNHIEVRHRVGKAAVPAWFMEGLATHMSTEPDCLFLMKDGVDHINSMTAGTATWATYTNDKRKSRHAYCQAAKEVNAWLQQKGRPGLLTLMDDLAQGKPFEAAYGRPLTF